MSIPVISSLNVKGAIFNVAESLPHPFWTGVGEGRWEPSTFDLLARLLKPDWRFVDIGAWVGPTALYAAKKCKTVDAYECDPVALEHLERNIAANPDIAAKIDVRRYALGEADGFIRVFSRSLGNSETSIFAQHERDGAVLDCTQSILAGVRDAKSVFRDEGYTNSAQTLVKIDVEGAEFRIIPHLAEIIPDSRCVWYVSFHELNINSQESLTKHARVLEMLRTLYSFSGLRWWNADLDEVGKAETLDQVMNGTWPIHSSLVFSKTDLPL